MAASERIFWEDAVGYLSHAQTGRPGSHYMSRQNDDRQLVPAYHYRGLLVGWRCSVCRRAFRVPLEQATDEIAPPTVQGEFQKHSCAETLIEDFRAKNAS